MPQGDGDTVYSFVLEKLEGGPLPLENFRGRPMVIANTASKCGFTPQYAGLQALWTQHHDSGLVVLGVPSNDFGGQEPGEAQAIGQFCQRNYGVSFPLAGKVHVAGSAAHPLFQYLARVGGFTARPRWNFYKYLIDRQGKFRRCFSSVTSPTSARFVQAVEALIRP